MDRGEASGWRPLGLLPIMEDRGADMISRKNRVDPAEAHRRLRAELEAAYQNWYLNHDPEMEDILWQVYWERYRAYRAFVSGLRAGWTQATA